MYTIYADGICIYNDVFSLDNMRVLNPKLVLEDNSAGSLSMSLPPTNKGYDTITRLMSDISVKKDGAELWAGRVLSESKDFWNTRTLICEGELAFFNDSSQPQCEYIGLSVREYMEALLTIHNNKVPENRQFTLGAVTITDDAYPTRYTNYEKTIELLNNLIDEYGGHIRVRKEQVNGVNVRYLDYLKEYPNTCSQVIQFGSNLMDFTRNWDSTEFATVIVPLGDRLDESPVEALDSYLTVESVNDGSIYVQSDDAIENYGWIEKVIRWDDVSDPEKLLNNAKAYLTDLQFDNMEINLTALDLHYLDVNQEAVNILDKIQVISRPHGLNRLFPVTKLEIPLDNPEKTQFTLGDTVRTSFTSAADQTSAAILKKIEDLPKAHTLLNEAKENAAAIMNMATTGYITIEKSDKGTDALYISDTQDYTTAEKFWKWSMSGLGYSGDGGETYSVAITMDGSIVADFITAGTLNADLIRAGKLTDVKGNNYWDLETGEFSLSASTKVGESSTIASSSDVDNLNSSLDQGEIFNRLTDNGKLQGIWLAPVEDEDEDGNKYERNELFINASYITTGQLTDVEGNVTFDLSAGTLTMKKGSINIGNKFIVSEEGELTATSGTFSGTLKAANIEGTLTSSSGAWLVGCGLAVGDVQYKTDNEGNATTVPSSAKFFVDSYGNVTMTGNLTLSNGAISWNNLSDGVQSNVESIVSNGISGVKDTADSAFTTAQNAAATAQAASNAVSGWTYTGSTYIDGSQIMTGTIKVSDLYGGTITILDSNEQTAGYIYPAGASSYWGTKIKIQSGAIELYATYGDIYLHTSTNSLAIGLNTSANMISCNGDICPSAQYNNSFNCRTETYPWNNVYSSDGAIQLSDMTKKEIISYDLSDYEAFFEAQKPILYRFVNGTSGRTHIGFGAQNVESALIQCGMDSLDFAGLIKSPVGDGEDEFFYGLRYSEFIALNTWQILKLKERVAALEKQTNGG